MYDNGSGILVTFSFKKLLIVNPVKPKNNQRFAYYVKVPLLYVVVCVFTF